MTVENLCSDCNQNCCERFFLRKNRVTELPVFIRVRWSDEEMMFCTCDNFDPKNKICLDYENRPDFCRRTGEEGNWPNNKCLLKKPEDRTLFEDFEGL